MIYQRKRHDDNEAKMKNREHSFSLLGHQRSPPSCLEVNVCQKVAMIEEKVKAASSEQRAEWSRQTEDQSGLAMHG
jgi:hypothetical protein